MASDSNPNENLRTLNQIAETLNHAVDVETALNSSLSRLVDLMGLESGWISLIDQAIYDQEGREEFYLAAHHNLPPGLAVENREIWDFTCKCQDLCRKGKLKEAYTEVRCSRLEVATGDRRGLTVHASAALTSGDRKLGILNIAGEDWASFSPRSLALLTNVGNQMGVAIERARLFDLLREKRTMEQASLLEFSNQLLGKLKPEDLMSFLVQEVRRLIEVDACTLILRSVDPDWLEFQAAVGWKTSPVESKQRIPFEAQSGPGWVMRNQRPLIVEDLASSDHTEWRPDWIEAEGFRSHAVVPMVVEGSTIGVLIINDRKPRQYQGDEVRFLQLMANQAAIALESARLHLEEIERQRMEQEMAIGRDIQLSLLPMKPPESSGWELGMRYQAARHVGGDFYDFFQFPENEHKIGFLIGDVSGKGVPAALFMAMCRTTIRTTALAGRSPAQALIKANELILKDSQADLFLSAIYASLDTDSNRLTYANAGHNRPILVRAGTQEIQDLTARGVIMGAFDSIDLEEQELEIHPGDLILLYTDGVTDAINAQQEAFGEERLKEVLAAHTNTSTEILLGSILQALEAFRGNAIPEDDITLVVARRLPQA